VLGGDYKWWEILLLAAIHIRSAAAHMADDITKSIKAADRGGCLSRSTHLAGF